jgi:hypothetical protein
MTATSETSDVTLDRALMRPTLGFWTLTIYGIGDILGAGISSWERSSLARPDRQAGSPFWSPRSFHGSSEPSCAEQVLRYPRSGGEAAFSLEAFASPGFLIQLPVSGSGPALSAADVGKFPPVDSVNAGFNAAAVQLNMQSSIEHLGVLARMR